jgi:HD superfamily phosphodiesterase
MTELQEQLLAAVRTHVTEIFTRQVKPELVFHNLEHTEDVVEACSYMADYYKLEDNDRLVLLLSAWFHDTGYASGEAVGHEERSIQTAKEFLEQQPDVDEEMIQKISSNIRATKMPQSPLTQLEKILCDADLYHLAADDYKARNQLLRQEQMYLLNTKISKRDWRRNNITFLETHKYFTDYGEQKLEPKKQRNLMALNKLSRSEKSKGGKGAEEEEEEKHTATDETIFPYISQPNRFNLLDDKTKQKNTERGIQTMFRTTSNNHFELSALADGKANIMISVNAIIISVVLTVLLVRLPFYPQYIIPTIILMVVCLSAMIFAILATRPSVSSGRFSEDDIRKKQANLLFFGNFHRMKLEEYEWGMNEMLKDREYLYNSMIKDIYFLGVVLARKYRLLRVAYTIFMWGLIATVIAFAAASLAGDFIVTNNPTVIDY